MPLGARYALSNPKPPVDLVNSEWAPRFGSGYIIATAMARWPLVMWRRSGDFPHPHLSHWISLIPPCSWRPPRPSIRHNILHRLLTPRWNHAYAVALHMMYYNFVRIHSTLRVAPAMAAGVSDRLWEIGDIVKLVEDAEAKPGKRGPYNKHNAN